MVLLIQPCLPRIWDFYLCVDCLGCCLAGLWLLDLFYIPSPASVVSLELVTAAYAGLNSPVGAVARAGFNNVTLGVMGGFSLDLNFSVISEAGTSTGNYTIRVIQGPARSNLNWTALVTGPSVSKVVTSNQTVVFSLSSNGQLARVNITVPSSVTISPANTPLFSQYMLGGMGWTAVIAFNLTTEDGSQGFYRIVLQVSDWIARISSNSTILSGPLILDAFNASSSNLITVASGALRGISLAMTTPITWLAGQNCTMTGELGALNPQGVLGIPGVGDDLNTPPSRSGAQQWVGSDGNLYLYGKQTAGHPPLYVSVHRRGHAKCSPVLVLCF
jgi:hypothetical protein